MALPPPICLDLPIQMHVRIVDIVDVETETTCRKYNTTIWVQESADEMILHRYETWFVLLDGDVIVPLLGFSGPLGVIGDGP